jgi:hypothetical protein
LENVHAQQEQHAIIQTAQKKAAKHASKTHPQIGNSNQGFVVRLGAMELLLLQASACVHLKVVFVD